MGFDHERLDVYNLALGFTLRAEMTASRLPRGRRYLADQLQRAALSIVLNVAEGAGKFSGADKASFYTRARGSGSECAAVLDVCRTLSLVPSADVEHDKAILERIGKMLTKLIKTQQSLKTDNSRSHPESQPESEPGFAVPESEPGFVSDDRDQ
jgi:four helix bundle protein